MSLLIGYDPSDSALCIAQREIKGAPRELKAEPATAKSAVEEDKSPSTSKPVEAVTETTTKQKSTKQKSKPKKNKKKKEVKVQGSEVISEREKRKSRLIVRNLPFKCTEEKLKFVFEVFGTVTEVSIPTKEKKSMGFGFVQMFEPFITVEFWIMRIACERKQIVNGPETGWDLV
eukprot:XP_011664303.1 PREDICTED: probable RNA-binding protein 19 [Strongylocentrotus purpuratus]